MDIQNVAVKFLTNKVNSDEELSKEQLKKWLTSLPDNVSKHIKKNISEVSKEELKRVLNDIHNKVTENKTELVKPLNKDEVKNPIVEFAVVFADTYDDDIISKKQFSDTEYIERVDKILDTVRHILLNKELVSFVDRTSSDWKIMLSDAKKSKNQTRYWNQTVSKEFITAILSDTNKGI